MSLSNLLKYATEFISVDTRNKINFFGVTYKKITQSYKLIILNLNLLVSQNSY
jgi:hypothetical protein